MKTALVTGASSGIGLAAAAALAQAGYRVIGIGRDSARCEQAKAYIAAAAPGANAVFLCADLMQQSEVGRVAGEAARLLDSENAGRLEVLINNTGCVRSWHTTTQEGYEQQFALNHLAGFLLTYLLLPQLGRADGRVIMTGSESHKRMRMRWDDVMFSRRYNPLTAYKQSKLANILFARGLNDRYLGEGLRAYVVDPGLVCTEIGCKDTGGLVNWVWSRRKRLGQDPAIPAKTYLYLSETQPAPESLYYRLCRPNQYSGQVTRENADRLFALSERLCAVAYPARIGL